MPDEMPSQANRRKLRTRAGLFMNGSAWLLSAFRDVAARPDADDGAKAEADPARIAAVKARNFMVRVVLWTMAAMESKHGVALY